MNKVRTPIDIPEGPHYAVLVYSTHSTHIPGDQRSRDAPGHGYPAHTETSNTVEHWVTLSPTALGEKIEQLSETPKYQDKPVFVVLKVEKKLSVTTRTSVDIDL